MSISKLKELRKAIILKHCTRTDSLWYKRMTFMSFRKIIIIIIIIIMLAYFYCAAYARMKVNESSTLWPEVVLTVYSERYWWWWEVFMIIDYWCIDVLMIDGVLMIVRGIDGFLSFIGAMQTQMRNLSEIWSRIIIVVVVIVIITLHHR